MAYRPQFRPQIGDPTTTLDGYICTFSSGAMALDYHTKGRIKVWGGQLVAAGKVVARDGGTLQELQKCWAAYGQVLDIETGKSFDDMVKALKAGRAAVVQGDYDQFSLATRCQDSFTGNHAEFACPEFSGTKVLMGDPLCKTYKWVELAELRKYMEKLGRANGLIHPASADRPAWVGVYYALTRALPLTTPTPTYPFGSKPYVRNIVVSTNDLRARTAPSTIAKIVKTYDKGTRLTTTLLDETGGKYKVGTVVRDDWYGIRQPDGKYIWIARGYTRLV